MVILYIYDSVRTCERENHFEAIDGTVLIIAWSSDSGRSRPSNIKISPHLCY